MTLVVFRVFLKEETQIFGRAMHDYDTNEVWVISLPATENYLPGSLLAFSSAWLERCTAKMTLHLPIITRITILGEFSVFLCAPLNWIHSLTILDWRAKITSKPRKILKVWYFKWFIKGASDRIFSLAKWSMDHFLTFVKWSNKSGRSVIYRHANWAMDHEIRSATPIKIDLS